jgi:glutathione synthase/RimK-type ligase-like ATP-grasp enzyme
MTELTIFKDFRGFVYSSATGSDVGVDLDSLIVNLSGYGFKCRQLFFNEFDITQDWEGKYVIYQSSEDRDLLYKDYIEDVLLALEQAGAVLIPHFLAFRCHHNKALQELIRLKYMPASRMASKVYGSLEDLLRDSSDINYPCVLKSSSGAKSLGVELCSSEKELKNRAKKISRTFSLIEWVKDYIKSVIRPYHVRVSQHKRKFIVQKFVSNLPGDFKVLIYGDRCVALERGLNPGDFRASGSGNLTVNEPIPAKVIAFCFQLARKFDVPFASFDVAMVDGEPELIEFQFITFGTTTLFLSERYYLMRNGEIVEKKGKLDLEETIASAIAGFISKRINSI